MALWLFSEVGEGNKFDKQTLRSDIKGVEQVDRRMRDLRPAGWIIKTYRDMPSLSPDELYLEKVGTHVWEPGRRSVGLRAVSARLRREILERDRHRCVRCGIGAGEEYPGEPGTRARLTLGHLTPHKHSSAAQREDLLTECARCNETARQLTGVQLTLDQVWDQVVELPRKEKNRLLAWMVADRRPFTRTEDAWARYRQLPAAHRETLRQRLGLALGEMEETTNGSSTFE